MDFDSLKVTAKVNSASYENRTSEQHTRVNKPYVSTNGSVSGGTNTASISAASNSQNSNYANSDEGNQPSAGRDYLTKLSNTINMANESLKFFMVRREFSYRVHEATNRVIVDVKNSETGEVIREIPSEEELDMIAKIRDLAGIFIDEKR